MEVTNTTEQVRNNPIVGLIQAMNIEDDERQGQLQLLQSTQLPSKLGGYGKPGSASEQYIKMGIEVKDITNNDELFVNVVLPEGWKKVHTDHSMWNHLIDNKGRKRAEFFFKSSFYDRDALIHFNSRYSIDSHIFLPEEEKGHYEKKMEKVTSEQEKYFNDLGIDDHRYMDGYGREFFRSGHQAQMKEVDVWIPKFKNSYVERNNTPHYYNLKDGDQIIFSTKDNPTFYRKKYTKKNRERWWYNYEHMKDMMMTEATIRLNEMFPEWKDINAYWNA